MHANSGLSYQLAVDDNQQGVAKAKNSINTRSMKENLRALHLIRKQIGSKLESLINLYVLTATAYVIVNLTTRQPRGKVLPATSVPHIRSTNTTK